MDIPTFQKRLRRQGAPPAAATTSAADEKFVVYRDLANIIGVRYSRVHLRRLVSRGLFPPAVYLSPNRCAWRLSDLVQWKASRITTGGEAV
jgi:predicted DNA-binding transcriptional regulator AlpA